MKSIMHQKDGTCYLCMKLEGNDFPHLITQEHHVIFGTSNRKLSEKYGLKVYLCLEHHLTGKNAVHNNAEVRKMLCIDAENRFEEKYPDISFREVFGKSWKPRIYSVKSENKTREEKGFWVIDGND